MNNNLLITRPENDDATYYLSKWTEKLIKEVGGKGLKIIDLWRKKANRERFIGTVKKSNPKLLFLNGHGNEDNVGGHEQEPILTPEDKSVVDNKIIYARSCRSGKILGNILTNQNGATYLGYKEDFWLGYRPEKISKPLEDDRAALFLEPSNYVIQSLLKGHSAKDANKRSKILFAKNIEKLLADGPTNENYGYRAALLWDMANQVCLGNQDATF